MERRRDSANEQADARVVLLRVVFVIIGLVLATRLFYLQIWRHNYYRSLALKSQLKRFEIPADRGTIKAYDGDNQVPLVLNEEQYTVFADQAIIKDPKQAASALAPLINADALILEKRLAQNNSRYDVLSRKVAKETASKIRSLALSGIGLESTPVRTYPEGSLAAQVLGFVNSECRGQYGIEGFADATLKGTPGSQKVITDGRGVPLISNPSNQEQPPKQGSDYVLTLDINIQRVAEEQLKQGLEKANSKSGSIIIMDPLSGAVKAMANFPSYNPAEYDKISDQAVFNNMAVASPLEPGSIMKTLMMVAALDMGTVSKDSTFYDTNQVSVQGYTVKNSITWGVATRPMVEILQKSLNTGAVYLLKSLGNGQIDERARTAWYKYLTEHFYFGKLTGIEQTGEVSGDIPSPVQGDGLEIRYANMSFGQGDSVTPIQMIAAFSAAINGGTYYKPYIVDAVVANGEVAKITPKPLTTNAVKPEASRDLRELMESVVATNIPKVLRPGYAIGGKTGTAQIANPKGGYYEDKFNGTYLGYVGGDRPQYAIIVRVNEPAISGFAGSEAAAPIFTNVVQQLMNSGRVLQKAQ